jgi:hypothetical protein
MGCDMDSSQFPIDTGICFRVGEMSGGLCLCHLQHKLVVFITEMESVYRTVRTGDLNKAVCTGATYSINWLVFITEMESVYSAVRTGALNKVVCACATYSINWLVFINEIKSVYSAVRTGDLNKAVCTCATYSINWLLEYKRFGRLKFDRRNFRQPHT